MIGKERLCVSIDDKLVNKINDEAKALKMNKSAYVNSILQGGKQIKNKQLEEFNEFKYKMCSNLNQREAFIREGNKIEAEIIEKQIVAEVMRLCQ